MEIWNRERVLILSAFTGAARELTDALIVNPFDVDEMADAIHKAINVPESVRRRRMRKMRAIVAEDNIYQWAGDILPAVSSIEAGNVGSSSQDSIELAPFGHAAR